MKQGVSCALAVIVALIFIGMLIPASGPRSAAKMVMCRLEESDINMAMVQFKIKYGSYPTGENSNIVNVLAGDNPQKIIFLSFHRSAEHPNEMVDPWDTPYKIEFSQQTNFVVR